MASSSSEPRVNFADQLTLLQTQNNSLRQDVEVLTIELGLVLNCIGKTFGASIVNKNSAHFKSVHSQTYQRESVKRSLAVETTEDEEADDAMGLATIKEPPNLSIDSDSGKSASHAPGKRNSEVERPSVRSKIPAAQVAGERHRLPKEDVASNGPVRVKSANKAAKKSSAKPHQCQFCPKSFAKAYHKQIHERRHTGERPHQCGFCDKSFVTSSDRFRHEMCHTGERPHQCQYCPDTFTRDPAKRSHELIHTGEKPHSCEYCKKRFRTRSEMSIHLRAHTGERPYICQICGSSYILSKHLRSHERVHS